MCLRINALSGTKLVVVVIYSKFRNSFVLSKSHFAKKHYSNSTIAIKCIMSTNLISWVIIIVWFGVGAEEEFADLYLIMKVIVLAA